MTSVSFTTLGCKVNQFESEALMAGLGERGYCLVPFEKGADITIINTCCVTHRADFESRQAVRRAIRKNPNSIIIVTGCYSQVDPGALVHPGGTCYLLGNREKNRIPDLLPSILKGELPQIQVSDIGEEKRFFDMSPYTFQRHTRAFLKIQDGCDADCSYCIVPRARGPSRSLAAERVIGHLRVLKEKGYKEAVLTGIHIGSYGLDLTPSYNLEQLLRRVEVEETPCRIRLSSIEPLDFSPGLISILSESEKLCPHLHIPIQSGEGDILKRMNRDYDAPFLFDLVRELYERVDKVSLGADVIVGFPGETDEAFYNTLGLIESLPLSYLHVFPFSIRKGTPAAQFPDRVDTKTIKERAKRMRDLGKEKQESFYRRFFGQELRVLVEGRRKKGQGEWRGFSRNYIPVLLPFVGPSDLTNRECKVVVTGWSEKGVTGRLAEDSYG